MDQIEEIKNKVDIVQLVGEYVKLNRAGRNYKGLCPFHGEKTPSFMVNPELQIYKCFGCGEGGDAYAFLEKMEGMDFGEALQSLAKRVGITLQSYVPTKGEEERERLLRINGLASDYYHYLLTKHNLGKEALAYLTGRGIAKETIETFKLGFAPEGWDYLMQFLIGKKGFTLQDLERAGLIVPSNKGGSGGYDRFRNRVMFVLNNHRGQTVGFAGRVMPGADEKAGGKYVNTPETEIYHKGDLLYGLDVNKAEIKTCGWAVVVEGEVDSLASYQAGVKNVVAIKGSALTQRQVDILKRYVETLVLALDADLAGDMAARRGIEIAEKAGMTIKVVESGSVRVNPKRYKDPGEWAIADKEGWRKAVEEAVPIYDFYITSAIERHGMDGTGKSKIGKELLPIWAKIEDDIVKGHYVKKLAKVLEVEEDDVRRQLSKVGRRGDEAGNTGKQPSKGENVREMREKFVVGLAFRNGWIEKLVSPEVTELIGQGFWRKVVDEVAAGSTKDAGVKEVIERLPPELKERVEALMLEDGQFGAENEDEWARAVRELELVGIEEKLDKLRLTSGDMEEVARLATKKNDLTKMR